MDNNFPILIFECANAHGGDSERLRLTIETFQKIRYPEKHIKFQAFHPDTISLPDFSAYGIYQDLLLSQEKWTELIGVAAKGFEGIWLDIFDRYGVEVLATNQHKIAGVKLQASVLENNEIITALQKDNVLSGKLLMLNISGFEIPAIENFIHVFSSMQMKELVLQIGHQAYPTQLKDTGIQKVAALKKAFPSYKICIADHVEAGTDFASIVPLLGMAAGCTLIEKHICLSRTESKYDHFSAIEFPEMQLLADRIQVSEEILHGPFISGSEKEYLEKSVQIPVAATELPEGSLIAQSDLLFRRTSQTGDSFSKLLQTQQQFYVLNETVNEKTTIQSGQYKKARIGVMVACRMKSERLKSKAILPIDGISSIELCLQNCLSIKEADEVVLTTSTTEEDGVLGDYTLDGKAKFWQGDPDDVIQRYLDACEKYSIDVVIRVTGDCPLISKEIASYLLKHHFATGADYTAAKESAVGTACEIYNVEVLKRVVAYVGKAEYSEYMTWYMQNNQDIFKVEMVDLPTELVRNYRLTLDYQEDLDLFNAVSKELKTQGKEENTANVFALLDARPDIAALNSHLTLKYKTDQALIDELNKKTRITKARLN